MPPLKRVNAYKYKVFARKSPLGPLHEFYTLITETSQKHIVHFRIARYPLWTMFTFRYERSTAGEEIIIVLEAGPADELIFDTADEAEAAAMYALDIERAVAKGPLAFLN